MYLYRCICMQFFITTFLCRRFLNFKSGSYLPSQCMYFTCMSRRQIQRQSAVGSGLTAKHCTSAVPSLHNRYDHHARLGLYFFSYGPILPIPIFPIPVPRRRQCVFGNHCKSNSIRQDLLRMTDPVYCWTLHCPQSHIASPHYPIIYHLPPSPA